MRNRTSFIGRVVDLLPIPQTSNQQFILSCMPLSGLEVVFHFKRWGTKLKVSPVDPSIQQLHIHLLLKTFMSFSVTVNYFIQDAICTTLKLSFSWVMTNKQELQIQLLHLIPLGLSSFTITVTTLWLCLSVSHKTINSTFPPPQIQENSFCTQSSFSP